MAITKIQGPTVQAAAANTVTANFGSTPTEGNLMVAIGQSYNGTTGLGTISGWTKAVEVQQGSAAWLAIFFKVAGAAEGTAVQLDWTNSTQTDIIIFEWSEVNTLDKIASTATTGGAVTSRSSGTTAATTANDELCIAGFGTGSTTSSQSFSNSFTDEYSTDTAPYYGASKVVSSTGAQETTMSWTTARVAGGCIATFKAVVSAFSIDVDDTVTLTEARALSAALAGMDIDQAITLSEALANLITSYIATDDTVTLAEARTISVTPHADRAITVDDTVTLSEARTISVTPHVTREITVSDTVTLAEARAVSVTPHVTREITAGDTVTLSESGVAAVPPPTLAVEASDSITLSEGRGLSVGIAFDAFSSATPGTGNLSWTHTPAGTPRGAIVYVVQNATGADRVSGVTYGGQAMTEVPGSPLLRTTGEAGAVYCYFLGTAIPTGAQTVAVTVTGVGTKVAGCITLTSGSDLTVQDTDVSITSTSLANPSAVLSLGGISSFAAIGFHSGQNNPASITPLANWSARYEFDYTSQTAGIYTYDVIGTADVTAGWTQTAEDALCIAIAVSQGSFLIIEASQGITVSDAHSLLLATPEVGVSESVTVAEAATTTLPRKIDVDETVTVTASAGVNILFALEVAGAETITVGESREINLSTAGLAITVSDAVTVIELTFYGWGYLDASGTDTAALSESAVADVTLHISRGVEQGETVTVSENAAGYLPVLFDINLSEGIFAGESAAVSVTPHPARLVDVDDTATITEAVTAAIPDALLIAVEDSAITVSDSGAANITLPLLVHIDVNVTLSEARDASIISLDTKILSVSDAVITLSEAVTLSIMPHVDRDIAVSDTIGWDDDAYVEFGLLVVLVSDAITIGEATSISTPLAEVAAGEIVTISEQTAFSWSVMEIAGADTVTLTESAGASVTEFGVLTISASDSALLAEAIAISTASPVIEGAETVTITESATASIAELGAREVTASDSASLAESATVTLPDALAVDIDDTVTLAESATASMFVGLAVTVSDSLAAIESPFLTMPDAMLVSGAELITALDTITISLPDAMLVSGADTVTISESTALAITSNLFIWAAQAITAEDIARVLVVGVFTGLINLNAKRNAAGTGARPRGTGLNMGRRDADMHAKNSGS